MSTSERMSWQQLHRLIRARKWDEVTSHLERHGPEDATASPWTNALHLACGRDPPLNVVEALIVAHPGGTSEQNRVGRTPLTVACQRGRGVSVGVVRALLEHDPESARVRDAWGGSALDALYAELGFAAARDRILRRGTGDGDGAGTISAEGSATTTAATRATSGDASDDDSDASSSDDPTDDFDFCDGWEKLCLILAADYHGSVSGASPGGGGSSTWRVVHACAGAKYAPCLPGLLRLAVHLHPEQVGDFDEDGRLPLHILLANARMLTIQQPIYEMIDLLVVRYPEACGVPDGRTGRLPLHTALLEGGGPRLWMERGVGSIYRAAPYAVAVRDVETGLFPFMLAAVGDGFCSITTIFELLRAFPELRAFSRDNGSES